jgi:hypothetical protein
MIIAKYSRCHEGVLDKQQHIDPKLLLVRLKKQPTPSVKVFVTEKKGFYHLSKQVTPYMRHICNIQPTGDSQLKIPL